MSTTMVTGGLGYVGRHLVAHLARDGDRVVSLNRDFADSDDPRVVCVQGELFDVPRLVRTLEEHGVERIVHTAAMSHPELSIDFPVTTFAANVDGTVHLLEAARLAGVRRVVNFSSHCSYGHADADPIPEDARCIRRPLRRDEGRDRADGLGLPPAVRRRGGVAARQRGLRPRQPDAHRPHGHAPRRARRASPTPSPRAATTGSSTSTSRTRRPRASRPPRSSASARTSTTSPATAR